MRRRRHSQLKALTEETARACTVKHALEWWAALAGLLYIHGVFSRDGFALTPAQPIRNSAADGPRLCFPATFGLRQAEQSALSALPAVTSVRASEDELQNDLLAELRRVRREEFQRLGHAGAPSSLIGDVALQRVALWRPTQASAVQVLLERCGHSGVPSETVELLAGRVVGFAERHPSFQVNRAIPTVVKPTGAAFQARVAPSQHRGGVAKRGSAIRQIASMRNAIANTTKHNAIARSMSAPAPAVQAEEFDETDEEFEAALRELAGNI